MSETQQALIIQGRPIGSRELDQVRQLLANHPDWHRRRLSQELARLWNWRNGVGRFKDMAARSLLLKLEQRGWITLPPRLCRPGNRMRPQSPLPLERLPSPPILQAPLATLLPLTLLEVSTQAGSGPRAHWQRLLQAYHYLGHRSWVGENLQYLVCDRHERPLACLLFGAAAWQCAARDRFIGWAASRRAGHLHLLANQSRFLIPPWVQVPQLATHVLSRVTRRLSRDWQAKYGHPIYLLETFVEGPRFAGIAYQAANWLCVGQTQGRTRQNRPDGVPYQAPRKAIYVYPLHPDFRERLQGVTPIPIHPPD